MHRQNLRKSILDFWRAVKAQDRATETATARKCADTIRACAKEGSIDPAEWAATVIALDAVATGNDDAARREVDNMFWNHEGPLEIRIERDGPSPWSRK